MLRLQKHRAFYYIFFADKVVSEGMYKQQAIANLKEMLYTLDF